MDISYFHEHLNGSDNTGSDMREWNAGKPCEDRRTFVMTFGESHTHMHSLSGAYLWSQINAGLQNLILS